MSTVETRTEPQKRKRGVWFYVKRGMLVFVAYAVLRVLWFFSPLLFSSHPRVTVGKDTTYVLGPLDENGYVDYVDSINEIASEGVTRENNVTVPLLELMGLVDFDNPFQTEQSTIFDVLKATPLPEAQRYKRLKYFISRSPRPEHIGEEEMHSELYGDQEIAQSRPWTKKEFAIVHQWVTENDAAIDRIVEATRRPRFYAPLEFDKSIGMPAMTHAASAFLLSLSEAARGLTARAMLRAKDGDLDGARDDIMACHRLARLAYQGPLWENWAVATKINRIANAATCALVHYKDPSAKWIMSFREQLAKLPEAGSFLDKLQAERLLLLEWFTGLAQDQYAEDLPPYWTSTLDHDAMHRYVNRLYNRVESALRKDDYRERMAIFEQLTLEAEQDAMERASFVPRISRKWFSTRRAMSESFAQIIAYPLVCMNSTPYTFKDRQRISASLTDMAMAMSLFRIDYGAYPKTLDELIPKYLNSIPFDCFADGPIHYRQEGDGYVIWSVGNDNEDNDGEHDDIVIRMPIRDEDHRE